MPSSGISVTTCEYAMTAGKLSADGPFDTYISRSLTFRTPFCTVATFIVYSKKKLFIKLGRNAKDGIQKSRTNFINEFVTAKKASKQSAPVSSCCEVGSQRCLEKNTYGRCS